MKGVKFLRAFASEACYKRREKKLEFIRAIMVLTPVKQNGTEVRLNEQFI